MLPFPTSCRCREPGTIIAVPIHGSTLLKYKLWPLFINVTGAQKSDILVYSKARDCGTSILPLPRLPYTKLPVLNYQPHLTKMRTQIARKNGNNCKQPTQNNKAKASHLGETLPSQTRTTRNRISNSRATLSNAKTHPTTCTGISSTSSTHRLKCRRIKLPRQPAIYRENTPSSISSFRISALSPERQRCHLYPGNLLDFSSQKLHTSLSSDFPQRRYPILPQKNNFNTMPYSSTRTSNHGVSKRQSGARCSSSAAAPGTGSFFVPSLLRLSSL